MTPPKSGTDHTCCPRSARWSATYPPAHHCLSIQDSKYNQKQTTCNATTHLPKTAHQQQWKIKREGQAAEIRKKDGSWGEGRGSNTDPTKQRMEVRHHRCSKSYKKPCQMEVKVSEASHMLYMVLFLYRDLACQRLRTRRGEIWDFQCCTIISLATISCGMRPFEFITCDAWEVLIEMVCHTGIRLLGV